MRVKVMLACTECKQRNYNTMKNKKNDPDRIEMMKYCRFCKKHTLHKETKQGENEMANKDATKKRASFKEYFKSVRVEMKKVVWPTKKETISYTAVVIATCAVFALGFWLIDTGVLAALKAVLNITMPN